jgi:hypothetical protein
VDLGLAGSADALSLVLGAWSVLVVAVATAGIKPLTGRELFATLLILTGLLLAALSRNLVEFWLGWELAGLGVWLALGPPRRERAWLLLAMHAPGWVLLAVWALGAAFTFIPPVGGAEQTWTTPVAAALAVVVLVRARCWPFAAWARQATTGAGSSSTVFLGIYAFVGPCLLAKALVAARWDPLGTWLLCLFGMAALLGNLYSAIAITNTPIHTLASLHVSAAAVGFALAPGSPVAAMGAVALTLSGGLWIVTLAGFPRQSGWRAAGGWSALLGGGLGVWAVSQGALETGYGVVAALLLPSGAFWILDFGFWPVLIPIQDPRSKIQNQLLVWVGTIGLAMGAVYPQAVVEWVLRPAVGAMAGGVRALRGIALDWGVGVQVRALDETLVAAFPATGLAFALFLALVVLYWLKRLAARFQGTRDEV